MYLCHKWPRICSVCRNHNPVLFLISWLITGFVIRVTRWMSLVEQELPTFPRHLSSSPFFVGFVFLNLKFSVSCFTYCCLSFWPLYYLSFYDLQFLITTSSIFKLFILYWFDKPDEYVRMFTSLKVVFNPSNWKAKFK